MFEYLVVTTTYTKDNEGYTATVPSIPGVVTCGDTLEELEYNLIEATELWLTADEDETVEDITRRVSQIRASETLRHVEGHTLKVRVKIPYSTGEEFSTLPPYETDTDYGYRLAGGCIPYSYGSCIKIVYTALAEYVTGVLDNAFLDRYFVGILFDDLYKVVSGLRWNQDNFILTSDVYGYKALMSVLRLFVINDKDEAEYVFSESFAELDGKAITIKKDEDYTVTTTVK